MGRPITDTTIDTIMVSAGTKSMGGGTVASIIGYMSSNGFAVLVGVLVTILGFICSVYFQRRQYIKNTEKWEIEKKQMLADEKRKEELHSLSMRKLRHGGEFDQEC